MSQTTSPSDTSVRVFIAVHVPAPIQQLLAGVADGIREQVPRRAVRWVRPENIHLTLRFIGNVAEHELNTVESKIQETTQGIAPFALQLGEAGCFPGDRTPRVLWIGLGGDLETLERLQDGVVNHTSGWGTLEKREFHPHLTLGRVTAMKRAELQCVGEVFSEVSVPPCSPWRVDAVHLMRSVLAPSGSRYSTLASILLAG